jgi:hypothetical protein
MIVLSCPLASCSQIFVSEVRTETKACVHQLSSISETDENWDASMLEHLATIRVIFQHVQNRVKSRGSTDVFTGTLPADTPLDEKSKKAGHHGAR